MSLGIPGSGTTAVLLGAFLVLGVQPGPLLVQDNPEVFWGIIASMYVGNIFLLILNLPLIPYIAKVLKVPRPLLISLVIMFSLIGVYAISFNTFDLYILLLFGADGFLMRTFSFPAAPFILAFILGGMMEQAMRQSLIISNGSWLVFVQSPISATLIGIALLSLIIPMIKKKTPAVKTNEKLDM